MRQWGANLKGGATTVLLERGRTYYFIDSVVGGCIGGRKLRVGHFEERYIILYPTLCIQTFLMLGSNWKY